MINMTNEASFLLVDLQIKTGGKDQESIQLSTTPDP